MKASDDDDGINGLITYNISRGLNNDHFSIEKDSGVIRTAKVLDYETINSYEIYVTGNHCSLLEFLYMFTSCDIL